uniref:Annexin A7 n=1 Tax=Anisakis simplex TaxID=6269 RepID=A0A0M3JJU5_ANISI
LSHQRNSIRMANQYNYAGQPPYQQGAGGYYPQGNNPYQAGPPPPGWNPQAGQPGGQFFLK